MPIRINQFNVGSLATIASDANIKGTQYSVDNKSVVDASIIEKLRELGYTINLVSNDSSTSSGMLRSLSQYIWPSIAGNVPAFRDGGGSIYLMTDRGQLYNVININKDPGSIRSTDSSTPFNPIRNPIGTANPYDPNIIKPDDPIMGPPLIYEPPVTSVPTLPPTNTPIPPGGIIGSGKIYTPFAVDDIVPNQEEIITRAMWTGGLSNLLQFHINPDQTESQLKYYIEVFNTGSEETCLAEPQYSIAFGNKYGSGSEDQGVQTDDTPTRAIYGQYRLLCLSGESNTFTVGNQTAESIYVININRSRFKDFVDEGNWQLNLQALTGYNSDKSADNGFTGDPWDYTGSNIEVDGDKNIVSLIDDSRLNNPTLTLSGEVYNIVSGSLENYNVNGGVHLVGDPPAPIVYGLFYKRLGVLVLDATKLDDNLFFGTVIENASGGGEINGDNPMKLFMSMSGSAIYTDDSGDPLGFQARSAERVKSTHYFCRLRNSEYNFSNNPSFVTGSQGDLAHPTMIKNPKVYVTTVGLYNRRKELVAVAKLSQPWQKSFNREGIIRVKLEY